MAFTHLHVHTEYSLLDGSNKIKNLIARVKELGMDSVAITDHGVMYGAVDFYREALQNGIHPVIGCEVYVAPGSRLDKTGKSDERYNHLVLLAENNTGYHNLMKLVSKGFTEGYYYKPRVDKELLREYHEGIIALSACLAGEVQRYLERGFYDEAKNAALELHEIFGPEHFYLELQDHGLFEQKNVIQGLLRLSEETGIELVATNDIHYTYEDDVEAHDILLCIQTGKLVSDENRMRYEGGQYYVKSEEEMKAIFPYAGKALENTHDIAMRCKVDIEFHKYKLPEYPTPQGYTAEEYLNKLVQEGFIRRYGTEAPQELKDRLKYELSVIKDMGFVDYFLIVWDFIKYAKDNRIIVGPGRGSAAGSVVSYCLAITELDPIKYSLLFERFLNPNRVTMPDIDIDFCFERRGEVIDYVMDKYGKDRVVQIVTFGTLQAKGVIRDVGRVLNLPYSKCDAIAKMVPQELGMTLDKALRVNPDLKNSYEQDEEVHHLIDLCKRLEGLPRHTSMHAAGVVISPRSIDEYVPLSRGADDVITTQFTMTTLEELGLLKMDFLGLRTLTVIQNAVKLINKGRLQQGLDPIDIDKIDTEDKKVYDLIGSGKTDGVFQLESAGMKSFMKELKPQCLEDIIAGISLYRPGPMDFIPRYIKGKNDPPSITYEAEELRSILEPTYGCIVYQEQVMQIVMKLAGYDLGRSDLVRRAMSKKKADVMAKEREYFIYGNEEMNVPGCVKNGISEDVANKIFDNMTDFAKYAFNKSHAAAYTIVSYETAWLKCYYPVEFMAALMTSVIDNSSKVAEYILVCRQMGIKLLPPDINTGESNFSVSDNGIRYGLSAIKNIGKPIINVIVTEREANGQYKDIKDFCERLTGREINKRLIENFIKAGAFDSLGGTRYQHMLMYGNILDRIVTERKKSITGQMDLFDFMDDDSKKTFGIAYPDVGEYNRETMLMFEKEVLGVYVSGHPLDSYIDQLKAATTALSTDFIIDAETGKAGKAENEKVVLGGIIADKTVKATKNGTMMAFITLEDPVGTVEAILFPKTYEKFKQDIEPDSKVYISGRVTSGDDTSNKLVLENIIPFDEVPSTVWLRFPDKNAFLSAAEDIKNMVGEDMGPDSIIIYCAKEKSMKKDFLPYGFNCSDELVKKLKAYIGDANVIVKQKPS